MPIFLAHNNLGWADSLNIGGHKYFKINICRGIENENGNAYTDSTNIFYNLQYGMLKFIVNDTLIYIRNLH